MDSLAGKENEKIAQMIRVTGVAQGIGFRPFVYRNAAAFNCGGWIKKCGSSVEIFIEGKPADISLFMENLRKNAPAAARIDDIQVTDAHCRGYQGFGILESSELQDDVYISPDLAICQDCRRELCDPSDRRHNYPFINCTHCGPRFTIIKRIPYGRRNTTMDGFIMCPECQKEYEAPLSRRFHAQPNACPSCGPTLMCVGDKLNPLAVDYVSLLERGLIGAIKSIGGFHLVCDAKNDDTVKKLRDRKKRETKPFVVMVRDMEVLEKYCYISPVEEQLLKSPQAPIVILKQKKGTHLPSSLNPGLNGLGVMLPFTPLHDLLFGGKLEILVMTSGNLSEEPIVYENAKAVEVLQGIADFFLFHDREIINRCDDSITRVVKNKIQVIRRARGYVPLPVTVPDAPYPVLALGGDMKNTFSLLKSDKAYLSQHMGDLSNKLCFDDFAKAIGYYQQYFQINPVAVAHDLHPDYITTRFAQGLGLDMIGVQHHQAHLAGCLAENNFNGEVLGLVCDGSGYGQDGAIWGFEFFAGKMGYFKRLAHLEYINCLASDGIARRPDRTALLYLLQQGEFEDGMGLARYLKLPDGEGALFKRLLISRQNCIPISSCGRLFDAVAAILGICTVNSYEGEAAMKLEALCSERTKDYYPYSIVTSDSMNILSVREMWPEIMNDLVRKRDKGYIATKFHHTVEKMIVEAFKVLRLMTGISTAALSGGTMQNAFLLTGLLESLEKEGFNVLIHRQIPFNDGGISLGQAVMAGRLKPCV
jgi:hydrogenase maturation protein HypF